MQTTVVLVDDHRGFRRALRGTVDREPDLDVVGEADDGEQGVAAVRDLRPDVVLMDLGLPGMSGLETIRLIREEDDPPRVIVLTMHSERRLRDEAAAAGAVDYFTKDVPPADLLAAIRGTARRPEEAEG